MVSVDLRDSDDITPMNCMRWLTLLHFIMEIEQCLKLVSCKDEYLVRPVRSLRVHVVDTVSPLGHETKIVAGAPDGPEQIWV